jgi:hypothetical protein
MEHINLSLGSGVLKIFFTSDRNVSSKYAEHSDMRGKSGILV